MITIYGASDDLVEVDGCEGADEFYVHDGGGKDLVGTAWRGDFIGPAPHAAEQLRVFAIYDGCWHLSIGQVDDVVPLPPWPLAFRQGTQHESDYSVVLTIDAPAGTRLDNIRPEREG